MSKMTYNELESFEDGGSIYLDIENGYFYLDYSSPSGKIADHFHTNYAPAALKFIQKVEHPFEKKQEMEDAILDYINERKTKNDKQS